MKRKPNSKTTKYIIAFWAIFFSPFVLVSIMIWLCSIGFFGKLPNFEELENPKSNLASLVISSDGKILGKYYFENRVNVKYDEISPYVINALICTEDARFRKHSGIDFISFIRVAYGILTGQSSKGGGSTITQQLAKLLFHKRPKSKIERIKQKIKEWVIAAKLERQYTKEEIITMYLNKIDFINNAVGIKSAAKIYFNTSPDSLTIEQSATLVGMVKNPALFNPLIRPDTTEFRRNIVLHQMTKYKNPITNKPFLTKNEYDSLKQIPLISTLHFHKESHNEGPAPYFREFLRNKLKIWCEKHFKANGEPYNLYTDGLKIYTTINSKMQKYAEEAVAEHLGGELQEQFFKDLKKKKNAPFDWRVSKKEIKSIMKHAIQRTQRYRILTGKECANCHRRTTIKIIKENGKKYYLCTAEDCKFKRHATHSDSIPIIFNTPVKMKVFTWKGEKDTIMSPIDSIKYYKSFLQAGLMSMDPHTGFIKAWVGGINFKHFKFDHVKLSKRQVGSAFKPIVYTLAIREGYSPCYEVPNVITCFDLYDGSKWCPENADPDYGYLVSLKYGLANSLNTVTTWIMKQFGPQAVINLARRMGITSPLDTVPSLCLGVADLTVFELTGALSTYANKGIWIKPTFITRIEDKNGNVIEDFVPEKVEVISEETAYAMIEMLKGVVDGVYNKYKNKKIGTGVRLRFKYAFKNPIAGKTGTTQNNSDGWFVGLTPDLVTGIWVGAEDRSVRFSSTYYGQGANMALPIWAIYMKKIYADKSLNISQSDFEKPDKPLSIELDCNKISKFDEPNF